MLNLICESVAMPDIM